MKYKDIQEKSDNEKNKNIVEEPLAIYGRSKVFLDPEQRYSYADYQTWMDGVRRELLNGIVHILSAPKRIHARIAGGTFNRIWSFVEKRKGKCEVYHAPFDVRLPKNGKVADKEIYTVVQPDICVICDPHKLDERGCLGAPDLIIEVQSPSTAKYDLDDKFHLYEESGVKEYWIVFPGDKAITTFILDDNGKYAPGTTYEYDTKIPLHIFGGAEIDLKQFFQD